MKEKTVCVALLTLTPRAMATLCVFFITRAEKSVVIKCEIDLETIKLLANSI